MYIYAYIYLYIYNIYICYHENNMPSGYHHNGFVATHALGHMVYMMFIHHVPSGINLSIFLCF